jgi:uncharacterized protein YrrD
MLIKVKTLKGYTLDGLDGEIGSVKEFYFDDYHWAIRYLVADAGNWYTERQVLISPHALVEVDTEKQNIVINLTKKQIKDSPPLGSDKPVSRQYEEAYHKYYGWPMYWDGSYMWGGYPDIVQGINQVRETMRNENSWNSQLRSTNEVNSYNIQASDEEIGHVEDFIIDDKTWAIRYLVVATHKWWPGKRVLISLQWIERVSWSESKVFINLSSESIKNSPEYTDETLLNRDYENWLHRHYMRQAYWGDEP